MLHISKSTYILIQIWNVRSFKLYIYFFYMSHPYKYFVECYCWVTITPLKHSLPMYLFAYKLYAYCNLCLQIIYISLTKVKNKPCKILILGQFLEWSKTCFKTIVYNYLMSYTPLRATPSLEEEFARESKHDRYILHLCYYFYNCFHLSQMVTRVNDQNVSIFKTSHSFSYFSLEISVLFRLIINNNILMTVNRAET